MNTIDTATSVPVASEGEPGRPRADRRPVGPTARRPNEDDDADAGESGRRDELVPDLPDSRDGDASRGR